MDPPREIAELLQGLAELAPCSVDRALGLRVALEALLEEAELERERDESLLRAVVQVALDPTAFGASRTTGTP